MFEKKIQILKRASPTQVLSLLLKVQFLAWINWQQQKESNKIKQGIIATLMKRRQHILEVSIKNFWPKNEKEKIMITENGE